MTNKLDGSTKASRNVTNYWSKRSHMAMNSPRLFKWANTSLDLTHFNILSFFSEFSIERNTGTNGRMRDARISRKSQIRRRCSYSRGMLYLFWSCMEAPTRLFFRRRNKPKTEDKKFDLGNPIMTQLWNIEPDNFAACRSNDRWVIVVVLFPFVFVTFYDFSGNSYRSWNRFWTKLLSNWIRKLA